MVVGHQEWTERLSGSLHRYRSHRPRQCPSGALEPNKFHLIAPFWTNRLVQSIFMDVGAFAMMVAWGLIFGGSMLLALATMILLSRQTKHAERHSIELTRRRLASAPAPFVGR